MPHPDYMIMLWCGFNPVIKYAGGLVMMRNKDYTTMPQDVEDAFRAAVGKFGLDWDKDWTVNDNRECPDPDQTPAPQGAQYLMHGYQPGYEWIADTAAEMRQEFHEFFM